MAARLIPDCCTICGHYLTMIESYNGNRCLDPGHWQAAGLVSPDDFYSLARITALARAEQSRRSNSSGAAASAN